MQHKTLVWFRQDLRLSDNPALRYAIDQGTIIPLYIFDELHSKGKPLGAASKWWLHHSLVSLQEQLDHRLVLLRGDPLTLIPELIAQYDATQVVWNRCYEPWQIKRDSELKNRLQETTVEVKSFNASLLWEPWQVLKKDGTPYKVFTPYYRKGCLVQEGPRMPIAKPRKLPILENIEGANDLASLELLPSIPWYQGFSTWQPGEDGAKARLKRFLNGGLQRYKEARDFPDLASTSGLSPHLHFGEISPNQVWYAALDKLSADTENPHLDCFLSELGWREFSYYLLYHFPDLPTRNFQAKFDRMTWSHSKAKLSAWQQGLTGVPIVDAGMRELWQTGTMHNRVRMIVGSYLVKNLGIHWHHGENWFWDCLLDADLASNSASWQWVAGSGADAAPYFRIFNPVSQGEKFDAEGEYVKRYCPELAKLPKKFIHQPWEAPEHVLTSADITLGKNYPRPLVDLKISRAEALERFAALKN